MDALDAASRGLEGGHAAIVAGLSAQLELAQRTGADVMTFIEEDLLPRMERIVGEACDKALELYDRHLAEAVNDNLVPLYNERIRPVYDERVLPAYREHVSPVVRTIEEEASVAIQKSREGALIARSKAASLVKEASDGALAKIGESKMDSRLPRWLRRVLDEASASGEWVVDGLSRFLLFILAIACRSLFFRAVGSVFSLAWFFCPLRLLVGGGGAAAAKANESAEIRAANGVTKSKTTKVKVH